MVDDSDSSAIETYLFDLCDDFKLEEISLTITRISRKKKRWLDKQPQNPTKYQYIYDDIKIITGCEGHHEGHYPLASKSTDKIDVGLQRNVRFKDENLGVNGHFIYFGLEINDKLYWYKFAKQ